MYTKIARSESFFCLHPVVYFMLIIYRVGPKLTRVENAILRCDVAEMFIVVVVVVMVVNF